MKHKRLFIGILVILIALAAVYFAGAMYFQSHYFPETKVGETDISIKTQKEAEALLKKDVDHYQIQVVEEGQTEAITAEDVDLKFSDLDRVQDALKSQNIFQWPLYLVGKKKEHVPELNLSIDSQKVKEKAKGLACMNPNPVVKSQNAEIIYDAASQTYTIKKESIGNEMKKEAFVKDLQDKMLGLEKEIDVTAGTYYKPPKYLSTDPKVTTAAQMMNDFLGVAIHYSDRDATAELSKTDIPAFLAVTKDFDVKIDRTKINDYVNKTLYPAFNTVGKTRTFKSKGSGQEITQGGGNYGWRVGIRLETDAIEKAMQKAANTKTSKEGYQEVKADGSKETVDETRKPLYLIEGSTEVKGNDIGKTYIDVDIDSQHMWYVVNNKVVLDTDFVSGDPTKGHDTPKGVWMIEDKVTDYDMKENPVTVKWWLPFCTERGIGFHDAPWRSSFGGEIYRGNGSHACVNMPPSVQKELFSKVAVNTPVIVH